MTWYDTSLQARVSIFLTLFELFIQALPVDRAATIEFKQQVRSISSCNAIPFLIENYPDTDAPAFKCQRPEGERPVGRIRPSDFSTILQNVLDIITSVFIIRVHSFGNISSSLLHIVRRCKSTPSSRSFPSARLTLAASTQKAPICLSFY